MSHENIEVGQIQAFKDKAMAQYGHVAKGEEDAKFANVLGYLTGNNIAQIGIPGGIKTGLNEASHLVIGGIESEHVAQIPTQVDLKPERVIGGRVQVERVTNDHKEEITTDIPSLISADTMKLEIDEITRANPQLLNALLELIRKGQIITTAGILAVPNLLMTGTTLNPAETRQATFPLADALSTRFAIGTIMGLRAPTTTASIMGGMEPQPDRIEAVTDLQELAAFKRYIASDKVSLPDDMLTTGASIVHFVTDRLRDEFNFDEADGRMAYQLRQLSKGVAAMNGHNTVTEEDLRKGAKYIYVGRLGMSGIRGSGMKVHEVADEAKELLEV
jgi:MoxR-like ATPase